MHRRNHAAVEGNAGNGYVETDPTGRYAQFEDILGRGAMKTVYKAIDEVLGVEVAWNQVKLNEVFHSPQDIQRLYLEVHLLSTLNHDSIVRFYTSWIDVDRRTFNFITEMFTSGTLREYRNRYKKVDIRAIKNWARQILEGLVYLHGHDPPVIHRDLKCDNIFVNGHLGQVKIGDLGLAAVLRGTRSAHSIIGTPEFMAPELYEEDYNELVDVYSFGMCVLEMLTSEYPYSECANPAQIYKKVTSGKLPNSFYRVQDFEAQRFIGKCLAAASKRLPAEELLADPFLAPDNQEILHLKKLASQKQFLNAAELEKLRLSDDPQRTDMTIIGKLNPEDDTIFLKVQITDKDDSTRNIYFPFDILHDTAMDVAMEMVKELEITNWDPHEIAEMIDAEISALVPNWGMSGHGTYHIYNYQENDDERVHHPFHSFSSCSSSHISFTGMATSTVMTCGSDWLLDDFSDDSGSHSSLNSGEYSNWSYTPNEEHTSDTKPTAEDQDSTMVNQKLSRFCPLENQISKQLVARNCYKHFKDLQKAASSKDKGGQMNYRKLTRNRSLVDIHSQLLHRSLVEELSKRRLFKTVGSVENVGFQTPCETYRTSRKLSGVNSSVENGMGKVS